MTSLRPLSSAYLAQVFSVGGSAALTLLSTWLLSPDERGQLAIVMLWFTLGSYIGSLGLPSQMLKFGAERNASEAIAFLFPAALLSTVTLAILGVVRSPTRDFSHPAELFAGRRGRRSRDWSGLQSSRMGTTTGKGTFLVDINAAWRSAL